MSSIIYALLNRFSGMELLLFLMAFIALSIGSYTDFKKREVPDWVSYSLIFIGLGIRLLYSAATFDWMFFVYGVIGCIVFIGMALLMFYSGQWGGGDAKILAGIGAVIGLKFSTDSLLISFVINLLFVGAAYGLVFSVFVAARHHRNFLKKLNYLLSDKKIILKQKIVFIVAALMLASLFFFSGRQSALILLPPLAIVLVFYLWLFVKSVEDSSFYKFVEPNKLTEGDWIVRDVKVKGKYICGPKDLGIEKHQIRKLVELRKKNKVKKILIKEGIPFVPTFLITFVLTMLFGNLMFLILNGMY